MTARTMFSVSALLLLSATWGRPARADIIHVPDDYPTIQEAIDEAAEAGDEIIVYPGTYNEAIDFGGGTMTFFFRFRLGCGMASASPSSAFRSASIPGSTIGLASLHCAPGGIGIAGR